MQEVVVQSGAPQCDPVVSRTGIRDRAFKATAPDLNRSRVDMKTAAIQLEAIVPGRIREIGKITAGTNRDCDSFKIINHDPPRIVSQNLSPIIGNEPVIAIATDQVNPIMSCRCLDMDGRKTGCPVRMPPASHSNLPIAGDKPVVTYRIMDDQPISPGIGVKLDGFKVASRQIQFGTPHFDAPDLHHSTIDRVRDGRRNRIPTTATHDHDFTDTGSIKLKLVSIDEDIQHRPTMNLNVVITAGTAYDQYVVFQLDGSLTVGVARQTHILERGFDRLLQVDSMKVSTGNLIKNDIGRLAKSRIQQILVDIGHTGPFESLSQQRAGPGDIRSGLAGAGRSQILVGQAAPKQMVGNGTEYFFTGRYQHAFIALAEVAQLSRGVVTGYGNHEGTGGRIADTGIVKWIKAIACRHGNEDSVGLQPGEFVFQLNGVLGEFGVPMGSQRQIDGGDRAFKRLPMVMHPLQCLFDPFQFSPTGIVKDAQRHQIRTGRQTAELVTVGRDNAGHMRAVQSDGPVIVGIGIVFGEIVTTDDPVPRSESRSEGDVIESNSGIDHGDRLPGPVQTVLLSNGIRTRDRVAISA